MVSHPYRYRRGNLIVPFTTYQATKTFAKAQSRNIPGAHYVMEAGLTNPDRFTAVGRYENGAWTGSNSHIVADREVL